MKIRYLLILVLLPLRLLSQDLHLYEPPLYKIIALSPYSDSTHYFHTSLPWKYPFFELRKSNADVISSSADSKLKRLIKSKVFNESLIVVDRPNFNFTVDPIFALDIGREFHTGTVPYTRTRAANAFGEIIFSEKSADAGAAKSGNFVPSLQFYSAYFESLSVLPPYLDSISKKLEVIPGQGWHHVDGNRFDQYYAEGWIRYIPNRIIAFEAGHGKNFIGDGYRSLILSDAARAYPYFRIDTKVWRIHYVNLWTELTHVNYDRVFEDGYQKKYGIFHYLNIALTDRLQAGLFEAIVAQGRDSAHLRGFDINYLNPVIFFKPVEYTIGSPDNSLLGINLNYRIGSSWWLYGQLVLDEFKLSNILEMNGSSENKQAVQIGCKGYIPLDKADQRENTPESEYTMVLPYHSSTLGRYVFLQTEFNAVRPYMYSHITPTQNYGHWHQSLAHPLGANFYEWVNFLRIRYDRFALEGRFSWARFGADIDTLNYGSDIYKSYTNYVTMFDNFIGQGLKNDLSIQSLTLSYLVNTASSFNLFITLTNRRQLNEIYDRKDLWFMFGIRSSVRNLYTDF